MEPRSLQSIYDEAICEGIWLVTYLAEKLASLEVNHGGEL